MAMPLSRLALLALMCMALRVVPSSAFVSTFPTTSHALRLRSARCTSPQLRVTDLPILKMSGGRNDDNDNHANQLNPNNDEYAGSHADHDYDNDNHSNQLNPNNDEYEGNHADHDYDNDNHSNQCNPNNDEYRGH